jgi:hypothetical protein
MDVVTADRMGFFFCCVLVIYIAGGRAFVAWVA